MFKKSRAKKASVSIPKRKWKTSRPNQKEWDGTVSDLTVHRASEEEVQRRRLIHKSKNASAARRALGERAKKVFMDPSSPGQVELEMKKLAILKEVLYEHDDLNEVLKRVDNTMSSVKTIFHGAPYRTSGNPNVTLAPGSKSTSGNVTIPVRQEPTTQMSLLSDSVMDKHALNEESSCSEDEEDDEEKFVSKVDYERFLNVLRESLKKSVAVPEPGPSGDANMTPVNNGKPETHQALNCTKEVKRTMTRIGDQDNDEEDEDTAQPVRRIDDTIMKLTTGKRDGDRKKNNSVSFSLMEENTSIPPPRANLTATTLTYEHLQDAMEVVTSNLEEIENRRGNKTLSETGNTSVKNDGLAGFTATLIDAVTRLTLYIKEAEEKLLFNESRMEDLKNQNDHQRALLDALTAELMGMQDQIQSLKDKMVKQKEESVSEHEEFKKSVETEVKALKDMINDLKDQNRVDVKASGDANSKSVMGKPNGIQMVQADCSDDKDEEEEALKSDMLSLLTALKSQSKKEPPQETIPQPSSQVLTMNNAATRGAAQTVASVESQLKHLQLQHAEAQNRLQELTQVAGFLAGKVAESESRSSCTSSRSEPDTPSSHDSSATPSIVSGPITPREVNDEFHPMVPTNGNETDDSVSGITITSSMFANLGGDTSRPSVQSSAYSQNLGSPSIDRRIVDDSSSLRSSDRVNISEDSFKELVGRNIPTLLQSNLNSMSVTAGAVKILNPGPSTGRDKVQSTLPSFKPPNAANASNPRTVTSSIQQTQFNLEDRISELNRQHAEAQARLQNLIRKRTDVRSPSSVASRSSGSGSSMKVIQVTLPTEDMLKTPQVHRAPEPFKPILLEEHSFAT